MDVLSTALMWHNLGIATIPVLAGSKRPALEAGWGRWQTELPPEAKLRAWFANLGYNIAIVCGHKGLVVVDFDSMDRHEVWQAGLDASYEELVNSTFRVRTRKGLHYYFYVEEETFCGSILWNYCQKCRAMTLHRPVPVKMLECLECKTQSEPGQEQRVDLKGVGGQAMTPPSIHPSGHRYQGFGSPHQIATIASVTDLLPEYKPVQVWQPRERKPYDPYEEAMREHQSCGISVEAVKAAWRWEDVIPVNGKASRGVVMTNCPFHNDEHASLAIYPDGHAHCFGNCGFHGDVVDAYAQLHKLTVPEALREMAR
jgi:hypothetical protein